MIGIKKKILETNKVLKFIKIIQLTDVDTSSSNVKVQTACGLCGSIAKAINSCCVRVVGQP